MYITDDIRYVGVYDRGIRLFENQFPVTNGMAYHSYLILDDKIAVMDSVERDFADQWLQQIDAQLGARRPDYLIVQHMEPDHSSNIVRFMTAYPQAQIVSSAKAFAMMQGFFGDDFAARRVIVKEGDTLSLGRHTLSFIAAPMVHWPEVIMTYDSFDKVLFSADAFGSFGPMDSNEPWANEARRYYIGVVGKYGAQVQQLLKKASGLDIRTICPLHGRILKENLSDYLALYDAWSSYRAEEKGVVIAYTSVYGHTQEAAQLLKEKLLQRNIPVVLHDLVHGDPSAAMADAFRFDRLVLATTTYNMDIFPPMRAFIHALTERGYRQRTVGLIENGSWAPAAAKVMRGMLENSKMLVFAENNVKILSALSADSLRQLDALAEELSRD